MLTKYFIYSCIYICFVNVYKSVSVSISTCQSHLFIEDFLCKYVNKFQICKYELFIFQNTQLHAHTPVFGSVYACLICYVCSTMDIMFHLLTNKFFLNIQCLLSYEKKTSNT